MHNKTDANGRSENAGGVVVVQEIVMVGKG